MPTRPKVKPFKDWDSAQTKASVPDSFKAEGDRVKRRAEVAKAAETAASTPETIKDPITREVGEPPAVEPVKSEADDWGQWVAPDEVPPHNKFAADVELAVAAVKARDAHAVKAEAARKAPEIERARLAGEKAKPEDAKRAARDARGEELRRQATVARAKAAPPEPEPFEPTEPTEVVQLREAAEQGGIGRLGPDIYRLTSVVDQVAGRGHFNQSGRTAAAGVLLLARDVAALNLDRELPNRNRIHTRVPLSLATELDDPAAVAWLHQQIRDLRDTPSTSALPLIIVVEPEAEPAELTSLVELAADESVAVVLLGSEDGWEPLSTETASA